MPSLLHREAEAGRLGWPGRALRAPVRAAQEGQLSDTAGAVDRSRLLAAKLRALAAGALGDESAEEHPFPGAASLRAGTRGWVLADERPERALGPALAWARRHAVTELHLLVDDPEAAGVLARRAETFRARPAVWRVDGRRLVAAPPAPHDPPPDLDPRAEPFRDVLAGCGVEAVVEGGVLLGEVLGLEVARVTVEGDEARLEVGVGRNDRIAHAMVHRDLPTPEALAAAAEEVRRHRRHDGPSHPLRQLSPERWLRTRIVRAPELVGAEHLEPADPPLARRDLVETAPATMVGRRAGGTPVVVVASVGIDLDLVPTAADARLLHEPQATLVLAVPERDVHPATAALAAELVVPAEVVGVPPVA